MIKVSNALYWGKGQSLSSKEQLSWWRNFNVDLPLLSLALMVALVGLLTLYSATEANSNILFRQIIYLLISLSIMMFVAQFNAYAWRRFALLVYVLALLSLMLVPWLGVKINGSRRWLNFHFFSIQPSEFMKIAVPFICCLILTRSTLPPRLIHISVALPVILFPSFLVFIQPDLGTALLICFSGFSSLFLAGLSWRIMLGGLIAIVLFTPIAWFYLLFDYHKKRILTLFDPAADSQSAGWNILQSKIAIGSGGVSGKGWLNGTQSHLNFLPEAHTDFIFSAFAEEHGFIGCVIFVLLFLGLLARGAWLSYSCDNLFGKLLGSSLILMVFIYFIVNVAMVSGLIPVVGVPLPFISYGGTSMLTLFITLGILMSLKIRKETNIKNI